MGKHYDNPKYDKMPSDVQNTWKQIKIGTIKPEWTQQKSSRQVKEFLHEDQQEVIHVIKTGFKDKYIVVHEDCHEMVIGNTYVGSKEEVKNKYKIEL